MTMWKRERKHFCYYVTNERKQPHIYVEALGTPRNKRYLLFLQNL